MLHPRKRLGAALALSAAIVAFSAVPALAHDLTVANGTSPASCAKNATFPTIQSAVNAAGPGDHIKVCPGTYQEYVYVGSNRNNLDLEGQGNPAPTILYPATPPSAEVYYEPTVDQEEALVAISQSTGVRLHGFTVSGPYTDGGCHPFSDAHYGVYVTGGGSARIDHNHVTQIEDIDPALRGCQDGLAIEIGNSLALPNPQTANGTVEQNLVDQYQKDGIIGDQNAALTIQNNVVTGVGPVINNAQNGIEVDDGSTGTIQNNTVTDNTFGAGTTNATGIIAFAPGQLSIQNNKESNNDNGVYLNNPGGNPSSVQNNQITASAQPFAEGVVFDTVSNGSSANSNKITGGDEGLDIYNTTASLFQNNQVQNATQFGLWAESNSTQNTLKNDQAFGNGTDCEDDSPADGGSPSSTSNFWLNDQGNTENKPGLCKPRGH
jgi:hypothetical protein